MILPVSTKLHLDLQFTTESPNENGGLDFYIKVDDNKQVRVGVTKNQRIQAIF